MKKQQTLRRILAAYAARLADEEKSPGTIEKYLRDTRCFFTWLGERPLTRSAVLAWRDFLLSGGKSASTINSMLSSLGGALAMLGREDCRVRFLPVQKRAFRDGARLLSREEYRRLLALAEQRGNLRLLLLMETMCATGMRVSELRFVTVEALCAGRVEIFLKGKVRTVLLPGKLCRKLLRFCKKQKTASGAVFLTKSGNPISRKQIWREMKSLCREANVAATKVFPHNLRHLFAVTFYRSCRDIVRLADVLGHSNMETTRIYLLTTGEEHLRRIERLGLVS